MTAHADTPATTGEGPFAAPVTREEIVARIAAHPLEGAPSEMRARFRELCLGPERAAALPYAVMNVEGPAPGLFFPAPVPPSTTSGAPEGLIVYFHGGGYVFGSAETHRRIAAGLARRTRLDTFVPVYPLAPEHPWPAQLEAALAAVEQARAPFVLAGDSAGGHLALVTALELARRGHPAAGLVLFSPNTDRSGLSDTRARNDPFDPMVDDEGDRALAASCFGDMPPDHPHVSPLLDDLALLPPLHVEWGRDEVLAGDARLLAERAAAAGVAVSRHEEPAGLHMGQMWTPWWDVADASLDRAAAFVAAAVARFTGPA